MKRLFSDSEISEKEGEENVQKESDKSSSDLNCFSQSVTHSNISRDAVVCRISGFFVFFYVYISPNAI